MAALRRGRERQRLSQADVADRLGVHMRTLRRWENGEGDPPAQVLFRWSEIVGVSIGANLPHRPGA
jgi:transcriptional regulator with XRE-family HTH domain